MTYLEQRNANARAGIPATADDARYDIAQMELHTKSRAAKGKMAEMAIKLGRITPEGKDVWREYLATL